MELVIYQGPEQIDTESILDEIIEGFLWIGNQKAANRAALLHKIHITHIVRLFSSPPTDLQKMIYLNIEIEDSHNQNIAKYFSDAIQFIEEAQNQKGKVLIHCGQGVSRSSTILIAYLMKKKNINLLNCFTFIKEKRKSNQYTHPNIGFFKQLLEFENSIFGENSMTIEQYEQITKSLSQY